MRLPWGVAPVATGSPKTLAQGAAPWSQIARMSDSGPEPDGDRRWDILDLRGLKCPLPALRTRKVLAGLTAGRVIEVHCTDPLSVVDIPHLVRQTGDEVLAVIRSGGQIRFQIRKRGIVPRSAP